jgi:hypothetical protein
MKATWGRAGPSHRVGEAAMNTNPAFGKAGVALAAAIFLVAPIAGAQHATAGGMMGSAPVRMVAPALRAPAGSVIVRSNGTRSYTSAPHRRGTTAPRAATASDFLFNSPPDPYLNSGTVPMYINGVLNAGPGSTFIGNNNLLGVKAFIDPVTELQLATYERLARDFQSAGIFVPLLPGYAAVPTDEDQDAEAYPPDQGQPDQQQPQQQQPQVIVIREEPQGGNESAAEQEQPNAPAEEQAPLRDEGEFLLIFRDGHSERAAAFTRSGDQVVYITPDGLRQSTAISEIDMDATQRVNQERGTPLQLSSN